MKPTGWICSGLLMAITMTLIPFPVSIVTPVLLLAIIGSVEGDSKKSE